ncbi:hypothetical protein AB0A98_22590 [Streptomyces chrestomyceticus]|uniref:hypothetical protein n=1 Tax=Streptomyces chrestomyceticus TaxID=68185 RepID=UPI003401E1D9
MRTIYHTWDTADVDEEYAEAVLELLGDRKQSFVCHEHEALGSDGTPVNKIQLVWYLAPDTEEVVWAVTYEDEASWVVQEDGDFDQADALYDEYVAELGGHNPGPDDPVSMQALQLDT